MKLIRPGETLASELMNRYKVHFYLFWVVLFAAQTYRSAIAQPLRPVVLANLAELGSSAAFACTVLFFLLPRFGKKGKKTLFILFTLLLLLLSGFVSSYLVYLIVLSVGVSEARADYWLRIPWETIYTFLVASSFGFVKIADDYFREKSRSEELKKNNLRSELEFLKAQLNPHFLFNTLNNLYFMVEKDPKRAAKMILMLSDILRYQIYETNTEKTSMEKEIENIKNYIELERIRKDNININFDISGKPEDRKVLPNILLPLVENAFKHLTIRPDGSCSVNISISETDGNLSFSVKNTLTSNGSGKPAVNTGSNGVGMANLKRRLELFYPGKYDFSIDPQNDNEQYEVKLMLYAD
jgi:two-component system, LytTR family, sensor kinase